MFYISHSHTSRCCKRCCVSYCCFSDPGGVRDVEDEGHGEDTMPQTDASPGWTQVCY